MTYIFLKNTTILPVPKGSQSDYSTILGGKHARPTPHPLEVSNKIGPGQLFDHILEFQCQQQG